jgi:hypothetical protein
MKRLLILVALLLGALSLSAVASAQDGSYTDDLTALAAYAPADAVGYIAVRTDDDYVATLDRIIERFADLAGEDFPGIIATLDEELEEGGLTFAENIRPWLGGAAAVVVEEASGNDPASVIAVQISNRELLVGYLEAIAANGDDEITRSEGDGYTLFSVDNADQTIILVADDVLLLGQNGGDPEAAYALASGDNLAANADFINAVGQLPAPSYNILFFLNTPEVQPMAQGMGEMATDGALQGDLIAALGPVAVGFATLSEDVLAVDVVSLPGDLSELEAQGLTPTTDAEPVDFAFADNIPADANLVIMDTGLGSDGDLLLAVARLAADINAAQDEDAPDGEQAIRQFEGLFGIVTGLNLREDLLANATGDYAAYLSVAPDQTTGVVISGAFLFNNPGAEVSQGLLDGVLNGLDSQDVAYTQEGTQVIVPGAFRSVVAENLEPEDFSEEALTALVGYNDAVFVIGSQPAASFSLAPDGESLADTAAFQNAQAILLTDAETVWFADMGALAAVTQSVAPLAENSSDVERAADFLSRFESATISSLITDDSVTVTRATLTLAGE